MRLRRYYWVILLFILSVFSLLCFFGDSMIIPYSTDANYQEKLNTITIENNVDIFDDSMIHKVQIDMDRKDYESLIATYEETGLKEYFKTDVVIDGVTIDDVGVRLKGQMTLQHAFKGSSYIDSMQLPFLIKFDKYVDGQNYRGITELAVRIGSSDSLLEEPLALYAHSICGAVVPECSYASVTVSDLDPAYYVICEQIDESYLVKYFNDYDGVLYKAGNFVDLTYKGDDQTEYMSDFEQKTQVNEEDLAPLISFLKFVSESSDEEFEEELPYWLDVDALITMMAVNDLVENSDSFSGMNSNYYFYYNPETEKFIILAWDMNLAFGAMMGQGNMQRGGAFENIEGGENRTMRSGPEGMQQAPDFENMGNFTPPAAPGNMENFTGPENMGNFGKPQDNMDNFGNITDGFEGPGMPQNNMSNFGNVPGMGELNGNFEQGGVNRGERGNSQNGENTLKTRFFANENFSAMYEERYLEIADTIYGNDLLLEKLDLISSTFTEYNSVHNLLNQDDYDKEVEDMRNYIEEEKEEVAK